MRNVQLNVNYEKYDEDVYMDNNDVYINHTGDMACDTRYFIHNTCEILFVEDGEAEYTVNGESYLVGPKGIMIIGATDAHSCRMLTPPYIRYGLYFMPSYLAALPMLGKYLDVFRTHPADRTPLRGIPEAQFRALCDLLHKMNREEQSGAGDSIEMRHALTWQIAILLKRLIRMEKASPQNSETYATMLRVRSHIDRHFSEDCSLGRLSSLFFIQPSTISRSFSSCFGTTVSNYITLVRISNAVRLLEESRESVTEIANRVGYGNINTFIRAFEKVMNASPLQYRKQHNDFLKRSGHFEIDLPI